VSEFREEDQPYEYLDYSLPELSNNITTVADNSPWTTEEEISTTTTIPSPTKKPSWTDFPEEQLPTTHRTRVPRPTSKRIKLHNRVTAPPVPASRPVPVNPTPKPLSVAKKCNRKLCRVPDCH